MADFDIAVIGAGLNGASVAREAAGRGLRVVLLEQADIGGGATAVSTGILGGIFTDIERGAFLRVRTALSERDLALRSAPHLVRPSRFVVPVHPQERPPAMLRAALFAYDRLAPRGFHRTTAELDLTHHEMGQPLKRSASVAFSHSDCLVDDTRLAAVIAQDAAERGCTVITGARCVRGERSDIWRLSMINRGQRQAITARALVNATGAWTRTFAETVLRQKPPNVAFECVVQIVLPALFSHEDVYVLQHLDKTLVYAIPFPGDHTLIGIATRKFDGDPAFVSAASTDIGDLCQAVGRYFREPVEPSKVVRAFAGVDVVSMSEIGKRRGRDGRVIVDRRRGAAPLLTIFGGTTTTARRGAELAVRRLAGFFVTSAPWSTSAILPGGDFSYDKVDEQIDAARRRWPFLTQANAQRLVRAYGSRLDRILGDAGTMNDLGQRFGDELTAAEVLYLMKYEFARFADDVLWRRSKLGLTLSKPECDALALFMASQT